MKTKQLKEQLRIQEDRSRRNNVRVDSIEEDENETLENKKNKLRSFLYDKLEITVELYIERAHHVRRRKDVKFNSSNIPRTIVAKFLDYKEKEEVMRRHYKLKDTTYLVREDFPKKLLKYAKSYGIRLKSCKKMESMQLLNPIR